MRIGYGYNRIDKEFDHAGLSEVTPGKPRLWIDSRSTDRQERTDMLKNDLRRGCTLVLLSPGDLGAGGELPILRREIEAMGVKIEICPKPDTSPKRPRGRPAQFDPTPEQDEKIKAAWYDPVYTTQAAVRRLAERETGNPVSRYQLHSRYGPRDQSTKKEPKG